MQTNVNILKERTQWAALSAPAIVDLSRKGVSVASLISLQSQSPFSETEWASFLDMNLRTLQRYKKENRKLDRSASERVLLIAQLLERGNEIFDGYPADGSPADEKPEHFLLWLQTPSI